MKVVFLAMLLLFSCVAFSGTSTTATTKITALYTYGEDGLNNDILVTVDLPAAGCQSGFWVRSTDSIGNKNISAYLLSAFHAQTNVYFGAYIDQLWSGSGGKFCKIHTVGLVR